MFIMFKVRGHEAAELDPLGLHAWRKWTDKAIASVVAVDTSSPQRNGVSTSAKKGTMSYVFLCRYGE